MAQWEYQTVAIERKGIFRRKLDVQELDELLNSMGQDGWDLVCCVGPTDAYSVYPTLLYTFKRPLSS